MKGVFTLSSGVCLLFLKTDDTSNRRVLVGASGMCKEESVLYSALSDLAAGNLVESGTYANFYN